MTKILENLYKATALGFALAAVVFLLLHAMSVDHQFGAFLLRWLHVLSGVLWIGLLWYFNVVQMPTMPKIPAELKAPYSQIVRFHAQIDACEQGNKKGAICRMSD